jgi:hypothetical protein
MECEYQVVIAAGEVELAEKVNALLAEGWELTFQSGLVVTDAPRQFFREMLRYPVEEPWALAPMADSGEQEPGQGQGDPTPALPIESASMEREQSVDLAHTFKLLYRLTKDVVVGRAGDEILLAVEPIDDESFLAQTPDGNAMFPVKADEIEEA